MTGKRRRFLCWRTSLSAKRIHFAGTCAGSEIVNLEGAEPAYHQVAPLALDSRAVVPKKATQGALSITKHRLADYDLKRDLFVGVTRGGAFLSGKYSEPPREQYVRVAMIPIATPAGGEWCLGLFLNGITERQQVRSGNFR